MSIGAKYTCSARWSAACPSPVNGLARPPIDCAEVFIRPMSTGHFVFWFRVCLWAIAAAVCARSVWFVCVQLLSFEVVLWCLSCTTSCNPIKSYLNSCSKLHLTSVIQDQDSANENQETISKYVKNCLMDMVVLKNELFIINYYGKTLKFKVKEIGSDKNKGDLCQDLSNLNLKT